ncbi:MAG TPA: NAD(P)-binding domain-containing protein [Actinospica sp.]|jgi:thioredoxin reductase|nr:NAD(P)-binding domain-containing protein [Actinospica sp.]
MTGETMDYLVIGAGPAGLQTAHYLAERGRSYLVLEAGSAPGTFFATYPRHRQLISVNKRHTGSSDPEFNMKMDWNSLLSDHPDLLFTGYTDKYFPDADDFVRYLGDFAAKLDLRVAYDSRAARVEKDDDGFTVTTTSGDVHRARRLIVSSGLVPNRTDIPGIEHAEHYATVSTDPEDFTGQRVLIIGSGNSAFETADNLVAHAGTIHVAARQGIRLAWHTHFVGHLRAVNNNFLDTYQLKLQNAVLDVPVTSVARREAGGYEVTFQFSGSARTLAYDRVIACTGFRFDASIFAEGCAPELAINDRFPAQRGCYESVNVPGLFFAGTLTQQLDYRNSTSGFIHGFRYGARALARVLDERYHGTAWPGGEVSADPAELTRRVLDRVNSSSGLWQQFGTLADVVVVPEDGPARYFEEMPVKHVAERGIAPTDHVLRVTLEYGGHPKQPFDGRPEPTGVNPVSAYFHPVIRHVVGGELVGELHLPSDLENDWRHPRRHVEKLRTFLDAALPAPVAP